jgi:hypothetical protein
MQSSSKVLKPTEKTYRLLYAKSGNRCAFPNCTIPISDGQVLLGEAAHIKAEGSGGPRYDADQTAEERRGYDNLILLCLIHHKFVDDDPIAYTVERLRQMKCDHEAKATGLDQDDIERVATLFVQGDMNVTAINPHNSITAGVFQQTITNYFGAEMAQRMSPQPYQGVLPKDGRGRFRAKGKPLGKSQSAMPIMLQTEPSRDIVLEDGPCFWLRLLPQDAPVADWTFHDLEVAAGNQTSFRLVTIRGIGEHRLTSTDGIGRYTSLNPDKAYSATFLFRAGEVWSVDTYLCVQLDQTRKVFALAEVRKMIPELITKFADILTDLRVPAPFRWIIGIEDVLGCSLAFDRQYVQQFWHPPLLTDHVTEEGFYTPGDDIAVIVDAFSKKVFAECGQSQPSDII